MGRHSQNNRFGVATAICVLLGELEAFVIVIAAGHFKGSLGSMLVAGVIALMLGVVIGMLQWFMPYAILVLGIAKLFEQKKEVLDELGDENSVKFDPDGERKLHDYLTAINSTEARIGLLQRSAPYVPPEERPPEDAVVPPTRMSRAGRNVFSATVIAGAVLGAVIAAYNGVGVVEVGEGAEAAARNTGHLRMFLSSLIGAVLALPVGLLLALLCGRVEVVTDEEDGIDDARGSGSETA